jgi:hypothetical protein
MKPGDKVMLPKGGRLWRVPDEIDQYYDVMTQQSEAVSKLDAAGDTAYHEERLMGLNFMTSHTDSIHDGATVLLIERAKTVRGGRGIARVRIVDDAIQPSQRGYRGLYPFLETDEMGWMQLDSDSPLR